MYLFIATDNTHRKQDLWYVGATSRQSVDKIKDDLFLDKTSACVDLLVDTTHTQEILKIFYRHFNGDEDLPSSFSFNVKGEHDYLANLLRQITVDYEKEHPSIRRSVVRWLTNVPS